MKNKNIMKILTWAQFEPKIHTIILEGSMGNNTAKDEFSDYDLNLFVKDVTPFLKDNSWFKQFDEIVVFQKEGMYYQNTFIPTRLVIYQNSHRVDFSLWPISILESWIKNQELPEFYKNGYEILLDKLYIAKKLPEPTHDGYFIRKPSEDTFLQTIYNFHFEAAIIAKYLHRNNLWFACKLSSGPIKEFLQKMIMWQTAEKANWELKEMNSLGKNLEEKISAEITEKLSTTFSRYFIEECWESLFEMMELFEEISKELSAKLEIEFPEKKIEKIINYINEISSCSSCFVV